MIQNIWFKIENTEGTERRKTSGSIEIAVNEDLHKAILNKTLTTQEQSLKYDFVAHICTLLNFDKAAGSRVS